MRGNLVGSVALIIFGLLGLSTVALFGRGQRGILKENSNQNLGPTNTANDISISSPMVTIVQVNGNTNHTTKITHNFVISNTIQSGLGFTTTIETLSTGNFQNELDKSNAYIIRSNGGVKPFSETTKVNDMGGNAYISDSAIPIKMDP